MDAPRLNPSVGSGGFTVDYRYPIYHDQEIEKLNVDT